MNKDLNSNVPNSSLKCPHYPAIFRRLCCDHPAYLKDSRRERPGSLKRKKSIIHLRRWTAPTIMTATERKTNDFLSALASLSSLLSAVIRLWIREKRIFNLNLVEFWSLYTHQFFQMLADVRWCLIHFLGECSRFSQGFRIHPIGCPTSFFFCLLLFFWGGGLVKNFCESMSAQSCWLRLNAPKAAKNISRAFSWFGTKPQGAVFTRSTDIECNKTDLLVISVPKSHWYYVTDCVEQKR